MKRYARNKVIIGLTGTFGSGKTTVARMLRSHGALIIDADVIVHHLLRSDKIIYGKIGQVFGDTIFKKDKTIDRKKLASLVFEDTRLLKTLNAIVHPVVKAIIRRKIREAQRPIIVIDAALFIEAGLTRMVDKVIVVTIQPRKQMERLLSKSAFSKSQIARRIKAQMPQEAKRRFADFVIDNSKTINETKRQVEEIRRQLWRN